MDQAEHAPLLSTEAAFTSVLGLLAGLIPEMPWWMRTLGVLFTAVLAIHTARRMHAYALSIRLGFPLIVIGCLAAGTWRAIWSGFHDDFPAVTGQAALANMVEFGVVLA